MEVTNCYDTGIYPHYVPIILYNKYIHEIHSLIMQFFYVDSNDYSKDQDGLFQMCYDEVVAEAKDTGDFPMYSENCLVQSAKWKMEDLLASV